MGMLWLLHGSTGHEGTPGAVAPGLGSSSSTPLRKPIHGGTAGGAMGDTAATHNHPCKMLLTRERKLKLMLPSLAT